MEIVHVTVEPPTDDFGPERLEGEVLSIEDERDRRERAKTPWRALGSFVDEIEQHKNDPWIALRLVDDEIARLRVGAMAVLVGGPGSGKSTLAANLLYQHAADVGPSIMQSIELPGIEFTARTIGIKCDESWIGVLTGRVPVSEMRRVTALERFVVLERDLATLGNLRITIDAMAKAFPKQPILIAVDYVQILENERERRGDREERLRVSDIVKALDAIARQYGVVVIALSQMSTSNAKAARAGDALGADAGELAAETSAFNRYATVALSIGKKSEAFEDGSRVVELSIGKWRMGEGDRVLPMREWGRSGLWRVEGPAKTAQEVRDGRDLDKVVKAQQACKLTMLAFAGRSAAPVTREQLTEACGGIKLRKAAKVAAITELLSEGELIEVERKQPKSKYWLLWTPERATQAGVGRRPETSALNKFGGGD
jgi:hypothetical protein